MYLSRVEIDVKNRQKTKDLTQLGAFHNWVEQSFPKEIEAKERLRHLWRVDKLSGKTYLLLVSENSPDLKLLTKYGVSGTAMAKLYDPFLDTIKEGQIMQFRLTANPTHSVIKPGEKQGRNFPHITVDQQQRWLTDRAEKSGFQIVKQVQDDDPDSQEHLEFDIVNRDWPILKKSKRHRVRLSRVTFEGLLRVEDADRFRQVLVSGIGREKAYGMGLMTVIPER